MTSPSEAVDSSPQELSIPNVDADSDPHLVSAPSFTFPFEPMPAPFGDEAAATDSSSALALSITAEPVHAAEAEAQELKPAIVPSTQPSEAVPPATWTSASQALKWLKSLETANSPGRLWLAKHRGDISIALSAFILLLALTGWGLHPGQARAGQSQTAPKLTLFERILIGLGVAEAPPQPVASGNPNVWVWVDVHTALYYCPGSELYGKTEGGKFALQREAQLDQFQPAARKNCE
jgi:hypothetical protein